MAKMYICIECLLQYESSISDFHFYFFPFYARFTGQCPVNSKATWDDPLDRTKLIHEERKLTIWIKEKCLFGLPIWSSPVMNLDPLLLQQKNMFMFME